MNSLRIETRALPFFVFAIIMFFGFYSKPIYAAMVLGEESQKEESEERKDETSESSEKREDEKSEKKPIQEKAVPVTEEVIIPSEEIMGNQQGNSAIPYGSLNEETSSEAGLTENNEAPLMEEQEMKEDVLKIMGYEEENILNRDGNKATVLDREKLFGIFQIKITSEIEFDDNGNVLNKKQSLWNRILSFLSF